MKNNALDYVCIFTGGSIRGGAYIGALRAMEELGLNNKCFVGSSVGSILATLYVVGYTPDELEAIFDDVNFDLFKDINLSFGKEFYISKGENFIEWLRENIEKKYYGALYKKEQNEPVTFKKLEKDLVIISTDLYKSEVKIFSKENTPDFEVAQAVRISSSMPGLLKPTKHENCLLVDGDLSRSWPIWKIVPSLLNYNIRILEFRLEGSKFRNKIDNTLDYLNSVYTTFSNFAADNVISTYKDRDKFDYIRLDAGNVYLTDFNLSLDRKRELYKTGYNSTINYFKNALIKKKQNILPHYEKIVKELNIVKDYIEKSKYIMAKNKLAELFVVITKCRNLIDLKYFDLLLDFYEKYLNGLNNTWGIILQLKDKNERLVELNQIIDNLNEKINEFNIFLSVNSLNH